MADLLGERRTQVTIDTQIAAADRELGMRRAVYPRRVAAKQMTQAKATAETEAMEAIVATLRLVKEKGIRE